jgi:putative DNA primase/helicase
MIARKFWVTFFDDVYARSLQAEELTLAELQELIDKTTAPSKEGLPLLKLARFGSLRSTNGSLRHDGNVIAVSGAELDHDSGEMPLAEAMRRFNEAGVTCLGYTSPSHTLAKPRWRIILPFSRELPPGRRSKMVDRANGVVGGVCSRESWSLSQAFFYGRIDLMAAAPFELLLDDTEEDVDEADELDAGALPYQPPKGTGPQPDFKKLDEADLCNMIETGRHYYPAASELAWRWAQQSAPADQIEDNLRALFDAVPAQQQDKKWSKRRASIARWAKRAVERVAATTRKRTRGGGRPLIFTKPDPWPDEVDGAELLDEIAAVCLRHVVMSSEAADAIALWELHTYGYEATMVTPRLLLKSAEKRSGKTTLLMLVGAMATRALMAANISASSVYRTVEEARPTLLIDEADTFLPDNEELRGVLNAGYMRGGQAIRAVGEDHEPRVFSCWCPVAIATLRNLPDTIEDRSIAITLTRRRKNEKVDRLRVDQLTLLAPLVSKARRWMDDNIKDLEVADPEIPNELNDRAADCWRLLLAIADCAGGGWSERARKAAVGLALANADIETNLTRLLGDLRDVFDARGDELFSIEIVRELAKLEHRPWAEWGKQRKPLTPVQMARLLASLKIRPIDVHRTLASGNQHHAKGYKRQQFADAFERYLS